MLKKINWMIGVLLFTSCSQMGSRSTAPSKKNSTLLTEKEFIRIYKDQPEKPTKVIVQEVVTPIIEPQLNMAPLRKSTLTNILSRYTNREPAQVKEVVQNNQISEVQELLKGHSTPLASHSSISIPSDQFIKQVQKADLDKWLGFYKKNLRSLQIHANRGQVYRNLIEGIFTQEGLPKELYFVGLIESGFKIDATSQAQAKGPWQFMKPTGKQYGLTINSQVDERVHLVKSTRAAAKYFKNLYNIFGSWELALSAYNAGEYRVINRIMKAQSRDFREISRKKLLPKETLNYVPKIAAVIQIHRQAKKFGLKLANHQVHPFSGSKSLKITKSIPLRAAAKALKVSLKDIKKLNPDIKVNSTPYLAEKKYELFVPGTNYSNFQKALASIKPQGVSKKKSRAKVRKSKRSIASKSKAKHHRVRSGENLYLIARKYKLSVTQLKKYNGLKKNIIHKGQKLRLTKPKVYSPIIYTVKKGDNLIHIAKKLGTSVNAIKKANKLKSSRLALMQKLKLPSSKKVIHTVRKGDNLIAIAKRYKNSLNFVKNINGLKSKRIYPGQKIVVNKL